MGVCFKIIVLYCLENLMDGGAWKAVVHDTNIVIIVIIVFYAA